MAIVFVPEETAGRIQDYLTGGSKFLRVMRVCQLEYITISEITILTLRIRTDRSVQTV